VERVKTGHAQVWIDEDAVLLTQLPDSGELNIWIAAGKMEQAIELSRDACWWAKHELGLTTAYFTGRRGWARVRSVINDGWVRRGTDLFIKEL
jgi:hypothetical protein